MTEAESRLTDLEIALTHQEALVEDLNAIVREQAERIDRLERAFGELARRLAGALEEMEAPPEANVRPPHW